MRRLANLVVPAVGGLFLWGCAGTLAPEPPFVYEGLSLVFGPSAECHERLGLHVTVRNASAQGIESFRHTFHLFDEEGVPIGTLGAARIEAELPAALPSGEAGTFCTSLDTAFHFVPQGELQVGQYRITQVHLADGTVWRPVLSNVTYPYRATVVRDSGDQS
jgi:hypothetical protein